MLNQNSESEYARRLAEEVVERWGKHSMSNRKEKKEENREGTQTRKHRLAGLTRRTDSQDLIVGLQRTFKPSSQANNSMKKSENVGSKRRQLSMKFTDTAFQVYS